MRWLAISVRWHVNSFVTKALPFCHKRFAASTSKTGKTSIISHEKALCFLGKGMVPNSQKWPTFLTTPLYKAEQFTLNLRQTYDSMQAIMPGKAQYSCVACHRKLSQDMAVVDVHRFNACSKAGI